MSSAEPRFLTLHELVQKARQKLNHDNWDYIVGGTETETTLRRNRASIDALAFRPRVLRDVSNVSARTTFLGRDLRLPLLLAPVGSLELFAEEAGAASARAAAEFGIAHRSVVPQWNVPIHGVCRRDTQHALSAEGRR